MNEFLFYFMLIEYFSEIMKAVGCFIDFKNKIIEFRLYLIRVLINKNLGWFEITNLVV